MSQELKSRPAQTPVFGSSGEQRRQDLIEIAYALIAERGFEGLRVREVAGRAGINAATLHYYFPTKEDLVQAVVQYLTRQFATSEIGQPTAQDESPLDELRQQFANLKYRLANLPQLFVVAAELELRSLRDPAITPILGVMYRAWHEHLVAILQKGIEQGVFKPDLDVSTTATAVMTLIKGFSYQAGTEPEDAINRLASQVENWLVIESH